MSAEGRNLANLHASAGKEDENCNCGKTFFLSLMTVKIGTRGIPGDVCTC